MPFKTKAKKEKSSARLATFVEGGRISYGTPPTEKLDLADSQESAHKKMPERILANPPVGGQIAKIAVLALIVISLQIILLVSHIGN